MGNTNLLLLLVFSLSDAWFTNEIECGLPMRQSHIADVWAHLHYQKTKNCVWKCTLHLIIMEEHMWKALWFLKTS